MTLDTSLQAGWDPAGETPEERRRWTSRALAVIGGLFLLRLAYAAIVPLDLVHDEAYYWDWSRQPAWGYYSKPPMIAWLIGFATRLGGSSTLVVRLPAIVLGTGALGGMYLLGSRVYGARAGFWATLLSAATPGNAALGLLMTIDAPLLFCWTLTLYALWRMWERGPDCRWWLLVATVTAGLGALSKQTMLGVIPLAGLFLLTGRGDRRELLRPAFWVWVIGALLFLAPVVWWNYQHDWITAQHTRGHFAAGSAGWLRRLSVCGEFLGSQFGAVSPVTAWLLGAMALAALAALPWLARRERFLLCFSVLPMAGVIALSLTKRVEPNWPAAFYPAGMVLLAGWGLGRAAALRPLRSGERALRQAVVVGAVSVVLTYALGFGVGLQGSRLDPCVRLRGWRQLGAEVGRRLAEVPRPLRTFVVVTERAEASELAFYLPDQPRVYLWNDSGIVVSQYDIWGGPRDKLGWDALIVTHRGARPPERLAAAFETLEPADEVTVTIGHGRAHRLQLWRGSRLRQWPDAARAGTRPQAASGAPAGS
jgi:undecaprenyl-diphosphatase